MIQLVLQFAQVLSESHYVLSEAANQHKPSGYLWEAMCLHLVLMVDNHMVPRVDIPMVSILVATVFSLVYIMQRHNRLLEKEIAIRRKIVENARKREVEYNRELEAASRELIAYRINFVKKEKMMEELCKLLQEIRSDDPEIARQLANVIRLVEHAFRVDKEWENFKMHFEKGHAEFFRILRERGPELTSGDLKMCALLRMNLSMKETARILGVSPESVKTARYRIRKKLGLPPGANLIEYLVRIGNQKHKNKLSLFF